MNGETQSAQVILHASEIAGLIGENRFAPVTNCLLKVFERCYPDKFALVSKEAKFVSEDDLTLQLIKDAGLGDQFANVSKKQHENITEAEEDRKDIDKKLSSTNLSEDDKKKIKDFTSSKVNRKFGQNHEKAAFKLIEGAKEDSAVYCLECKAGSLLYKIVGKIDGRRSETVIIEIKNRMYRFKIQPFDLIQVQVYLRLTGAKVCELHEALKDKESIYMRSTNLVFDHEKWPELEDKIADFVVKLDKFSKDKDLQMKYLKMNFEQRKEVYDKL